MPYYRENGKEFSSCVISKIRCKLGLKDLYNNSKECSNQYWNEALITVATDKQITEEKYRHLLK